MTNCSIFATARSTSEPRARDAVFTGRGSLHEELEVCSTEVPQRDHHNYNYTYNLCGRVGGRVCVCVCVRVCVCAGVEIAHIKINIIRLIIRFLSFFEFLMFFYGQKNL